MDSSYREKVMQLKTIAAMLVVLSMACASPEAETPGIRAFGNEPFWNVTVSAADGIVYGRMGEADISFPYEVPHFAAGDSAIRAYGPVRDSTMQHEIEVQVVDEECPDTMADVIHPMRARVVVDGEELVGCAISLDEAPPGERP
jgi:uncharacterized membrane protein